MSKTVFSFRQLRYHSQPIASVLCLALVSTLGIGAIAKASTPPLLVQSQPSEETNSVKKKFLGQWQAKNPSFGGISLIFIFTPDDKLFIFVPSAPGTSLAYESGYRINPNTQPMQMDVSQSDDERISATIFEFTADGKLRLENVNPGQPRPTAFTSKALIFEKISEITTLPPDTQVLKPDLENNRAQANRSRQSEGKQYISSMSRAQQAYYLEKNAFATTIAQLEIGIKPETENFRYRILSQGDRSQRVIMTATAKRSGLKSYTGAVFVVRLDSRDSTTITGVCETNKPSSTPPTMPKPPSNASRQIQCPAGSHLLN